MTRPATAAVLTTDESALRRSVLLAPADDAPRLILADWHEEAGQPERAAFIRVQCELARLGRPPVVVTEPCVLTRRYGPGYFTLTGGELTDHGPLINRIQVGSRVDVLRPRGKKPAYGLRVHKIGSFNDPGADSDVVVVRDAESRPWAGDALRRRERELLDRHWGQWIRGMGLVPDGWKLSTDGDDFHAWQDTPFDDGFRFSFVRGFVRGFVAEARLPTAAFFGGPCGTCADESPQTRAAEDAWRGKCQKCDGFGRTPGLAAALFAAQPVERVRLVDREPYWQGRGWAWYDPSRGRKSAGVPDSAELPNELYAVMCLLYCGGERPRLIMFDSEEKAHAALSAACVRYGRRLAGLPPLPE